MDSTCGRAESVMDICGISATNYMQNLKPASTSEIERTRDQHMHRVH
jgi:hypothetical protein